MTSSEKIRGSRKGAFLGPYPLDPVYQKIGILHEHRDNNDVYNFPPIALNRGTGSLDPHEGSKTKHFADPFNVAVHQNNHKIFEFSGPDAPIRNFPTDDSRHDAASAFTQIPTSQNYSLERLQRKHPPHVINKNLRNARNPSKRPRWDEERQEH